MGGHSVLVRLAIFWGGLFAGVSREETERDDLLSYPPNAIDANSAWVRQRWGDRSEWKTPKEGDWWRTR